MTSHPDAPDDAAIAAALGRARDAARGWAAAGVRERVDTLVRAGHELARRRPELDRALYADGLSRSLARYYGDWIVHQGSEPLLRSYGARMAEWVDTGAGGELLVRRPDGVVLLIPPGNSPTINGSALFSLLLPGNAVLVRAPASDGGLRFLVGEILRPALEERGFSADLLPLVSGRSRAILGACLPRPELDTVVFFGNSTAGASVATSCHEHGKKVVLELDGSDHMIVWRDADVAGALESARHAFDFSTQPCAIPKHFLVHHHAFDRFVAGLEALLPEVSRTIEADPSTGMLAPVARPDRYTAALDEVGHVGDVLSGGYRMNADGRRDDAGAYIAPTIVSLAAEDVIARPLRCFADEIFFPLIPVVKFEGDDDAVAADMIRVVRDSPFGLRCSVWAEAPERVGQFTRSIGDVGLLVFNDDHAQAPEFASPWGGPKRSGGPHGESHFFWHKTSRLQAVGCRRLTGAQIDAVRRSLGV